MLVLASGEVLKEAFSQYVDSFGMSGCLAWNSSHGRGPIKRVVGK